MEFSDALWWTNFRKNLFSVGILRLWHHANIVRCSFTIISSIQFFELKYFDINGLHWSKTVISAPHPGGLFGGFGGK